MPTSRTFTWQNSEQRLQAAPETDIETQLRQLAFQALQGVYGQVQQGQGLFQQAQQGPTVTPELIALVQQSQNATLGGARAAMASQFGDISNSIYDSAASRGLLDSSYTSSALGLAGRGLTEQYGQLAAQSQAQSAQQLIGLAGQQQNYRLQLLQLQNAMQQYAANPQLLQDLTQFRLATGTQYGSSFQKVKGKTPTDITGMIGSLGALAAAIPTGGASLAALPAMSGSSGEGVFPRYA